ncbi:MAG: SMC-Scp complex subunit ScpB [Burkholderiales bacterium]|jgi:segregation and condensation protein B|uniref:SMC-Scp complex subunit ScpB n=1 Tax=Limnobacter sp. TaxID=2003368 RepID=UPI0039BD09A9|nr:SMC-Scp complex subunit ScpB [Burkholderiales bacterium]
MDPQRAKNILEAALLCSVEPIAAKELMRLFDDAFDASVITTLLEDLRRDWTNKGLELVQVKTGWRFQTREDVKRYLEQMNPEKPPKYSRATMETLAIIAYKQPVTRGDIESIRGVTVSTQVMKALEDRGWIESIGHRDAPGRPALWATTAQFLADLNLASLSDLPALDDEKDQQLADELQKVIPFDMDDRETAENDENQQAQSN